MTRLLLLALLFSGPAIAASVDKETPAGRFALDTAACKAGDIFATIGAKTLTLPTFSCEKVGFDQTENKGGRALWSVDAKACSGEEDSRPKPQTFKIALDDRGLQIFWKDGTRSAVLVRCK